MSSLDQLEITLENSVDGKYQTGQTVQGKLVVTLWRSLKIQGIEMKVRGRCHAEWTEGTGDQEHKLYDTEEYMNESIIVFGKATEKDVPHVEYLESGKHVFSFKCILPGNIPSSFEGAHGYVRYWVKAKIHGVWGLIDQSGKVEFGVERALDLNKVPGAMEPAEDEDSCVICSCCLNQGAISASFRINRRGFVSGESIICDAEIHNEFVSSIKSTKIKIYQIITYGDDPYQSNTREKQTICEQFRHKIKPGQEEIYSHESLTLPTMLPVTSLPGCTFIDIDYVAELKVCCPKEDINMRLPLLIIIGTIPLKNATPIKHVHPIRDIVADSQGIPAPIRDIVADSQGITAPIISQPNSNNDMRLFHTPTDCIPQMSNDGLSPFMDSFDPPSSSVPPITTQLDEFYPPMAELSIPKRERTLTDIYGERRRPQFLRIMAAVNEGAELDDDEAML